MLWFSEMHLIWEVFLNSTHFIGLVYFPHFSVFSHKLDILYLKIYKLTFNKTILLLQSNIVLLSQKYGSFYKIYFFNQQNVFLCPEFFFFKRTKIFCLVQPNGFVIFIATKNVLGTTKLGCIQPKICLSA